MTMTDEMEVKDYYYDLPQELIAQTPIQERDHSRLLVLEKETGAIEHRMFYEIVDFLDAGDCLVLNDSRVLPARLFGTKIGYSSVVEFLLLRRIDMNTWELMVRPGKKAKPGTRFSFGDGRLIGEVLEVLEGGNRKVRFEYEGVFEAILDELGEMPLPPYIKEKLEDKERYQTVYSRHEGSAAAPTAGLHFTKELLAKIEAKGVQLAYITLHVGLGTFRPVKVERIEDHKMHSEYYVIDNESAEKINHTKAAGGKIVCVGTTSVRTLESAANEDGSIEPCAGWTEIFIYPGYRFKLVDRLITNFHLPESTLIMLVSALAGREHILNAYQQAIDEKYRFFSFGDAMFVM